MLKKLQISNYAIIEELEIEFSKNFNVITGETGAGKSILMGALSMILGDRADTSVLLDAGKKCVIEGLFYREPGPEVKDFIRENDLDFEGEFLLRREISAAGKSRAFINDSPVNLEQLRTLSGMLVDLHRQFDTLALGETDFQRQVVDAFAGQGKNLTDYQVIFEKLRDASAEFARLTEAKSQFAREFDYNKFLFEELEKEQFHSQELEELDTEVQLLNNAENIKSALDKACFELKESDQPIVQHLKTISTQLRGFAPFHPMLASTLDRLQSVQIELQDITGDLERIQGTVSYDAGRIEQITERLSAGYKLMKKHGVKTTAELLSLQETLKQKLQLVLDIDDRLAATERHVQSLSVEADQMATRISTARKAQITPLEQQVNALLVQVGMPNAVLGIRISPKELDRYGFDRIEFLFDANKTGKLEPLRKIASGGELSRLMLCIKSLVAELVDLPTMIFDEIDTGISGEAARQVGIILKKISRKRQVLCITHQPQIAGKGDAHYVVYKERKDAGIKTNIRILSREERITVIAEMLGGEKPTAAALENAKEMVN